MSVRRIASPGRSMPRSRYRTGTFPSQSGLAKFQRRVASSGVSPPSRPAFAGGWRTVGAGRNAQISRRCHDVARKGQKRVLFYAFVTLYRDPFIDGMRRRSFSYAGPWPGKRSGRAALRALFVGLTTLKGYFYTNLGGTHMSTKGFGTLEESKRWKSNLYPGRRKKKTDSRGRCLLISLS